MFQALRAGFQRFFVQLHKPRGPIDKATQRGLHNAGHQQPGSLMRAARLRLGAAGGPLGPGLLGAGAGSALNGSALPGVLGGLGGAAAFASLHSVLPAGVPSFQEMGVFGWLLVDVAINWAGWGVAAALKTEAFYDLLGSVSFLTLSAGSLVTGGAISARKVLVTCMVVAWAVRLGSYLVARIHSMGKDSRFDGVRDQPGTFFVYWTMQALWVWLTLMPVLIVNGFRGPAAPLGGLDIPGLLIYGAGLSIEAIADAQKWAFRQDPANKGKFINTGLWSCSRYPNYFGEMMIWLGVFLTCAPSFTRPLHFISVVSPVSVALLLSFVSGVPLQERQAKARWGNDPAYQQYRQQTPLLVPLPKFGSRGDSGGGRSSGTTARGDDSAPPTIGSYKALGRDAE